MLAVLKISASIKSPWELIFLYFLSVSFSLLDFLSPMINAVTSAMLLVACCPIDSLKESVSTHLSFEFLYITPPILLVHLFPIDTHSVYSTMTELLFCMFAKGFGFFLSCECVAHKRLEFSYHIVGDSKHQLLTHSKWRKLQLSMPKIYPPKSITL